MSFVLSEPAAKRLDMVRELARIRQMVERMQFLEALGDLAQLLAQDPHNAQVWMHIGFVYVRMSIWPQAMEALQAALQIEPRMPDAQRLLAMAYFCIGQRQRACELIDEAVRSKKGDSAHWMTRAYIHAHISSDPVKALAVARDWGRRFADPLTRQAKPLVVRDRSPGKRLRIGYVTADFRQHSVAFFMQPVLEHHDPQNVEVHVYSSGQPDHFTERMRGLVPFWHEVGDLTEEELLQRIRSDGIDVLVDLSGYTQGNRLGVFARRAAPVQVTWIGYLPTLGMKAMDYRLVDESIAPASHAAYYAESLFQLSCSASYVPPDYAPLCEQPPMLDNGYPTLISLNSSAKITDDMLRLWARVLNERQDARLIIMVKEQSGDAAQAHMQPRVQAAGMPLDRVSVLHQQSLNRFMETGHIADVALDTAPVSGGTTSLHALWMGLSIVCLDAERGVEACTARTLQSLGAGGIVAKNEDAYVQAALELMNDPERLQLQRLHCRAQMQASPWMDHAARVKEVEKAYRLMWLNWLDGKKSRLNAGLDLGLGPLQSGLEEDSI
ncbi:O-linked N-acetylglucosamine transferase, SPINDLY family protein [Comamonas composti]|uniref:O-linked N-acetylglucosamine transferase, SPINDLY family protein n=1 Tax=Comamonas composti TaxID=408558 RepID=UPI0003F66083|nr:tetratricopeptide repeat protein [Comamonas composti]